MAKILLVDDDIDLCQTITSWLELEHHSVETSHNGNEGLEKLRFYEYDLVILDWSLPGISGVDLCRAFRQEGGKTPVIMLTGKSTVTDKESGLDSGADDYVIKPVHVKELAARVRAVIRRSSGVLSNTLQVRDIVLDPAAHTVKKAGVELFLPPREFALLEFLMRNPERVFTPEALIERVWQSESEASPDALRTCLKRLRSKIDSEDGSSVIRTIHRVGYKLEP